jgi:hypothetical protein
MSQASATCSVSSSIGGRFSAFNGGVGDYPQGGYGGGVARKQWLIDHEKRHA